jgi:pyruvate,water dikinase
MQYIRFFNELSIGDVPIVGGKNASLGEMYQNLTPKGVHIPNGFATTSAMLTGCFWRKTALKIKLPKF